MELIEKNNDVQVPLVVWFFLTQNAKETLERTPTLAWLVALGGIVTTALNVLKYLFNAFIYGLLMPELRSAIRRMLRRGLSPPLTPNAELSEAR